MVYVRVRLRFDSSPLHYAKKCWFVFDADQCSLVKDVAYLIARQFDLNQGIQLYMDDFLIPVNESAQVIRDNDLMRVTVVECESSNTTVVQSEEEQSPKVKRRKADKSEGQKKQAKTKSCAVPAATPKSAIARTTNQQVKPLVKVGKSSNKSKSSEGELKAVTSKSSTGGLHITFQSSSSSESTSESESSSSDSSKSDTTVGRKQKNTALANNAGTRKVTNIIQIPSTSVKASPSNGSRSVTAGAKGKNGQTTNLGVSVRKRGGRKRKKTLPATLTVGGNHDVLTTKSKIYKSPVMNKKTSGSNHQTRSKESSDSSTSSSDTSSSSTDKAKKSTAPINTTMVSGKEVKKLSSQWDLQPAAAPDIAPSQSIAAKSALSANIPPPAVDQTALCPPRDYSVLPELQGPPRQGDKLAFKVLELSSSYTPVVSEYKEATVLNFDPPSKVIQVEYTEGTLMKLKSRKPGKFELRMDVEDDQLGEPRVPVDKCDEITLESLIEPKLIT